jgi:organic radical activating enzyme
VKDIQEILELARCGQAGHAEQLVKFLQNFEHVVLRGAGKFGATFGSLLLDKIISRNRLHYWDIRAKELEMINEIRVVAPFSVDLPRPQTLLINCIPNGSLSGSSGPQEFISKGYLNHISGMALYEALLCSMKPETGYDPKICIDTKFCNWTSCKRLLSILKQQCKERRLNNFEDELVFQVATFIVNQKCTLQCAHCGQYINSFPEQERINIPLERIKKDIDHIFSAVDAIGFVSLIGGEPFAHPDINEIIEYLLTKNNFGVLGITTNGIFKFTDRNLTVLKNDRTRVIFSDYTRSLSEKRQKLFHTNVEIAKNNGINYSVGEPLWAMPPSLLRNDFSTETMSEMKLNCSSTITCKTIQNGVYYPCSTTNSIAVHSLEDYPTDKVVLDNTKSTVALRKEIQALNTRQYFQSCNNCGGGGALLERPGEQGRNKRYIHIGKR